MKKHIISLYSLVVILIITQTITLSILLITKEDLSGKIQGAYDEIENDQKEISSKINQISENIVESQANIENQISELKKETSQDFSSVIEESVNSVVTIITDVSQGTGFIIDEQGYIVTNAHVLNRASQLKIISSDREQYDGELLGYNLTTDIALLRIPGKHNFLELEESKDITIGEKVIAIGNPLGLSFSITEGIVSAKDRKINNLPAYIQTDVALNPGNSGGPLINKKGKAIGINNFKIAGEGLGFALESDYIKKSVNIITRKESDQEII